MSSTYDPVMTCRPLGAPRQGPPRRIYQTETDVTFIYLGGVTVEDPEVLAEPYVIPTRTLRLNKNPDAGLLRERGNCEVYELEDISSQIRH